MLNQIFHLKSNTHKLFTSRMRNKENYQMVEIFFFSQQNFYVFYSTSNTFENCQVDNKLTKYSMLSLRNQNIIHLLRFVPKYCYSINIILMLFPTYLFFCIHSPYYANSSNKFCSFLQLFFSLSIYFFHAFPKILKNFKY